MAMRAGNDDDDDDSAQDEVHSQRVDRRKERQANERDH